MRACRPRAANCSTTHCAISGSPASRWMPAQKQRFGELMERVTLAQAKFDENVLDATNAWSRHVESADELAGLAAVR